MTTLYIRKIEKALARPLTASEKAKASEFFSKGYSLNYSIEYFK